MLSRSRYALAAIAVIASIVALAMLGAYAMGSASGSSHGAVRLAAGIASRTWVSGVGDDASCCAHRAVQDVRGSH